MKTISIAKIALTVSAIAFFSSPSITQAATIADRATLDALLGGAETLETFESFTNTSQIDSTQVLNSTTNWAGQGTGLVAAGVDYTANGGDMFLNANGYYGLTSHTLGDATTGRALNLDYTTAVTAFGIDLQGYNGYGGAGTVSVFDTNGALLDATTVQAGYNGSSTFFGFENAGGIGRVVVAADPGDYLMIDNHAFGAASAAVPEPTTWAMVLVGFGMMGASMRNRRRPSKTVQA